MILLHRLNGDEFALNADLVETIEERPDTTITLVNDRRYIVRESLEEVIQLTIEYHRYRGMTRIIDAGK